MSRCRLAALVSVAFAAACNAATLGDGQGPARQETSPGTVTLRLDLPSTRSFCDRGCGISHISIIPLVGDGHPLWWTAVPCGSVMCSSECVAAPCTAGACPPGGWPITEAALVWDGSYYDWSTCGGGTKCYNRHFVRPGRYFANMCATPGTITQGDGGWGECTSTGPQECVEVLFDFPGPPLVEATLPEPDAGQ
jgi:hypothetical protein